MLRLQGLTYEKAYLDRARVILQRHFSQLESDPTSLSFMVMALDYLLDRSKEVAVIGLKSDPATTQYLSYLWKQFLPNKVIAFAESAEKEVPVLAGKRMLSGKTTIFVCENKTCRMPATSFDAMEKLLHDRTMIQGF